MPRTKLNPIILVEAIAPRYMKVRRIPAAVPAESAGAWAYMALWSRR